MVALRVVSSQNNQQALPIQVLKVGVTGISSINLLAGPVLHN